MKPLLFILILVFLPAAVFSQTDRLPLPQLPDSLRQELTAYLTQHHQTPEEYVVSKFKDYDVVFVGEQHRIKENVELIQRLIPLCYAQGIYTLGTEFARREDQPLLDSLLYGAAYDESLARRIGFLQFTFWGYQECLDIFHAAWRVNHDLAAGARRFRVLGLNNSPDWSLVKTEADREKHSVMVEVWHHQDETDWARVLLDEVVARGEKALVFSGIHHAFSEYKQPVSDKGKFIRFGDTRLGNAVYEKIGKRCMTIYLHAPWNAAEGYDAPMVYPVDGVIDALMAQLGPRGYPVGFDTHGTPFGKLPGETSLYKFGYDHFTLENYCDGYIFQMPISLYTGVTPIKDFVNASNLEIARQQSPNPYFRTASCADFNSAIAEDADMPGRFSRFK
jgi:hypothetical protein